MEIKIYKAIKELKDFIEIDDLFLWCDYKPDYLYPLNENEFVIWLPLKELKERNLIIEIDKNELDYKNTIQYKTIIYNKKKNDLMIRINKTCFEKKKKIELILKEFENKWEKANGSEIEIELNMSFKINKL